MKNLRMIVLFLVAAATITGCADTEKILTKKEGRWQVTSATYESYTDGVLDDSGELEAAGFIVFNSDGSAIYEDASGNAQTEYTVTWSYDEENDRVTLNEVYEEPGITITSTYLFDVLESSNKSQSWFSSNEDEFNGTTIRLDFRWELSRAD